MHSTILDHWIKLIEEDSALFNPSIEGCNSLFEDTETNVNMGIIIIVMRRGVRNEYLIGLAHLPTT